MTIFTAELAFNIDTLNFNLPFQGTNSMSTDIGSTVGGDLPDLAIGTGSYSLPAFSMTYDEVLIVDWAGTRSFRLLGNNLSYSTDGSGQVFSGKAVGITSLSGDAISYGFAGFALPAADLSAASHTASTTDDLAYVTRILAGNDLVTLSALKDVFNAGLGRDLILDRGGSDRINAGGGNDLVLAGKGNDRVDASLGNDVVLGEAGDDRINGGTGADVLWAGVGSDTVTGGAGADAFLFKAGDGLAEITDFNAADDQILFMGLRSDLINVSIIKEGGNVRVTFSDVSVLLIGKTLADVSRADIAVGGNLALNTACEAFFTDWTYFV